MDIKNKQKKLKERKKKAREQKKKTTQLRDLEGRIEVRKKENYEFYMQKKHRERQRPVVRSSKDSLTKDELIEKLQHNLKILETLEAEYDREQEEKKKASQEKPEHDLGLGGTADVTVNF